MKKNIFETIIIGGGHAGLSASYYLKTLGIKHIVFERGRVGESWRSQRWDSFLMNTSNRVNVLPGDNYTGKFPEGFCTAGSFVSSLEAYVSKFELPVAEQVEVISLEKEEGQPYFTVIVSEKGIQKNYKSRQVIICSGGQNEKKIPAFATNLPAGIAQLHAGQYRNASQLPDGAVLVTGSAQSGCQITEDLLDSGRKVFLSTSMVARIPRRYRGKDCIDWLLMMGFFNLKTQEVADPKVFSMKPPQLSGTGDGTRTMSLQDLARKGAVILGRMIDVNENKILFNKDAHEHVKFADEFSKKAKDMIDGFISKNQLTAPPPDEDPADMPDTNAACASSIISLTLKDHNIQSIIWSTGFNSNFSYVKFPVLDTNGNPIHKNGMTEIEGLYFLGLPWLRSRKSALINGIKDDAEFITDRVYKYARQRDMSYEI